MWAMWIDWAYAIWFLANLSTGVAYFHIPYEIWQWTRGGDQKRGFPVVGWLFIAFILLCGLHHLMMLTVEHHATPPRQVATDVAMAVVSVSVGWVLHFNRVPLRGFFAQHVRRG